MAHHRTPEIDRALEVVVSEINSLTERQDGGPGVVLTAGGLVIAGTIIPDWQWFDEVEHVARAAFTVHTGGSIDDEHGGWARLLRGVSESLVRDREEHRAAQNAIAGLSESYRRLLAREDRTTHIHLSDARVLASGVSPLPPGGMHWRGRLSEVSGWSFGHLGESSPASVEDSDRTTGGGGVDPTGASARGGKPAHPATRGPPAATAPGRDRGQPVLGSDSAAHGPGDPGTSRCGAVVVRP